MAEQPGSRVLVVDDEPALVRALGINLRAAGWEVHTAVDGAAAREAVASLRPDVVLLDLGLPDMDGIEVLARLRGWTDVPVVVLSARRRGEDEVEALDLGADDYVTKPFAMNELLARLRAAVRRAESATPHTVVLEVGGLRPMAEDSITARRCRRLTRWRGGQASSALTRRAHTDGPTRDHGGPGGPFW